MLIEGENNLLNQAIRARENASPCFSGFKVGSALLCDGGRIYTGCNIENASIGLSICAERVAIVKAISEGEQLIRGIAIVADTKSIIYPCGSCRQMILEFAPDCEIILANLKGAVKRVKIDDLLPYPFDFDMVKEGMGAGGVLRSCK